MEEQTIGDRSDLQVSGYKQGEGDLGGMGAPLVQWGWRGQSVPLEDSSPPWEQTLKGRWDMRKGM